MAVEIRDRDTNEVKYSDLTLKAVLAKGRLERANLRMLTLTKTRALGIDLKQCLVQLSDMTEMVITGSTFDECNFAASVFTSTFITKVTFKDCDLRAASFDYAQGGSVVFDNCNLSGASFKHAQLAGAMFNNCNCTAVDFSNATLANTTWPTTNVSRALFDSADLQNADFSTASAKRMVDFTGATCIGVRWNWMIHPFVSEILYREAIKADATETDRATQAWSSWVCKREDLCVEHYQGSLYPDFYKDFAYNVIGDNFVPGDYITPAFLRYIAEYTDRQDIWDKYNEAVELAGGVEGSIGGQPVTVGD